jgi:hypothetical protein
MTYALEVRCSIQLSYGDKLVFQRTLQIYDRNLKYTSHFKKLLCGPTENRTPNSGVTSLHYSRLTMRPNEELPSGIEPNYLDYKSSASPAMLWKLLAIGERPSRLFLLPNTH